MSSQNGGASGGPRSLWGRLFGGRGEASARAKDEAGNGGEPQATASTPLPTVGVAQAGVGVGLEFDGREMMPGPSRGAPPVSPSLPPHNSEHGQASTHPTQETAAQPSEHRRGAVVREHGPAPLLSSLESRPASSSATSARGASTRPGPTPHAGATGLNAPVPPVVLPPAPPPTRGNGRDPPLANDKTQQPTRLQTDNVAVKPGPTPLQPEASVESLSTAPSEPPASVVPPDEAPRDEAATGTTVQQGESGAKREEGEVVSLALRLGESIRRRLGGVMALLASSSSSSSSGSDDDQDRQDLTAGTKAEGREGQGPEGAASQAPGQQSKRRRPPKSQRTPVAERLQQATPPSQQQEPPQATPQQPQPRQAAPSLRQPPQQQASRQSLGQRGQQAAPPQQPQQQALPPQQIAPPKRQPSRQQPLAQRWQQVSSVPQPIQPQPRPPPPPPPPPRASRVPPPPLPPRPQPHPQMQQPRPAVLGGRGPLPQSLPVVSPSLVPQGGGSMGQGRGGRPMLARPPLDAATGRAAAGMAVRPEWTGLPPGPPFMPPPAAQHSMQPRPISQPPQVRAREGPGNGPEGSGAVRPDAPGFPAPPLGQQGLSLRQAVQGLRGALRDIIVQREAHQRRVAHLTVLPRPYDPAWNWELEKEVGAVRALDNAYSQCEARLRQLEPRPQGPPTQQANASASASLRQREDEWLEAIERSMARRREDAQHVQAQSTQPVADKILEARRQSQATGGNASTVTAPPPSPASPPHASPRPGMLRPSAPAFAFTPRHEMPTQPSPVAAETRGTQEPKDAAQDVQATPPPVPQEPPAPPPSVRPSMAQQAPSSTLAPVVLEEGGGRGAGGAPPSQEGVVVPVERDRQPLLQEPGGHAALTQQALAAASARQREKEWLEAAERSMPMRRQELEYVALESRNCQLTERLPDRPACGQVTGGNASAVTAAPPSPASPPHASPRPGMLRPSAPAFAFTPRHEMPTQPSPVAAETRGTQEPKDAAQDVQATPPPMPQEPPSPVLSEEEGGGGDDDSIEKMLRETFLHPSSPQSPLAPHTPSPDPLSSRHQEGDGAVDRLTFLTPPPHTGPSTVPAPPSAPPGLVLEAAPPVGLSSPLPLAPPPLVAPLDQAPISAVELVAQRAVEDYLSHLQRPEPHISDAAERRVQRIVQLVQTVRGLPPSHRWHYMSRYGQQVLEESGVLPETRLLDGVERSLVQMRILPPADLSDEFTALRDTALAADPSCVDVLHHLHIVLQECMELLATEASRFYDEFTQHVMEHLPDSAPLVRQLERLMLKAGILARHADDRDTPIQLEYRPPAVLSEGLSLEALAQEQSGQYLHHLRQQLQQTNAACDPVAVSHLERLCGLIELVRATPPSRRRQVVTVFRQQIGQETHESSRHLSDRLSETKRALIQMRLIAPHEAKTLLASFMPREILASDSASAALLSQVTAAAEQMRVMTVVEASKAFRRLKARVLAKEAWRVEAMERLEERWRMLGLIVDKGAPGYAPPSAKASLALASWHRSGETEDEKWAACMKALFAFRDNCMQEEPQAASEEEAGSERVTALSSNASSEGSCDGSAEDSFHDASQGLSEAWSDDLSSDRDTELLSARFVLSAVRLRLEMASLSPPSLSGSEDGPQDVPDEASEASAEEDRSALIDHLTAEEEQGLGAWATAAQAGSEAEAGSEEGSDGVSDLTSDDSEPEQGSRYRDELLTEVRRAMKERQRREAIREAERGACDWPDDMVHDSEDHHFFLAPTTGEGRRREEQRNAPQPVMASHREPAKSETALGPEEGERQARHGDSSDMAPTPGKEQQQCRPHVQPPPPPLPKQEAKPVPRSQQPTSASRARQQATLDLARRQPQTPPMPLVKAVRAASGAQVPKQQAKSTPPPKPASQAKQSPQKQLRPQPARPPRQQLCVKPVPQAISTQHLVTSVGEAKPVGEAKVALHAQPAAQPKPTPQATQAQQGGLLQLLQQVDMKAASPQLPALLITRMLEHASVPTPSPDPQMPQVSEEGVWGVGQVWARSAVKALLESFPSGIQAVIPPPAHLFPPPAIPEADLAAPLDKAMEGLAQRSVQDLLHLFKGAQGRSGWVDERLCKIAFVLHLARLLPPSERHLFAILLPGMLDRRHVKVVPLVCEIRYYLTKSLVLLPAATRGELDALKKLALMRYEGQSAPAACFLQQMEDVLEQMCLTPIMAADMFDTFKRQAVALDGVMAVVGRISTEWIERVLVKTGLLEEQLAKRSSQRGDASLDSPASTSAEPSWGDPTPLELTAQPDDVETPPQADLDIGTGDVTARMQRNLTQIECLELQLYRLRERALTLRQKMDGEESQPPTAPPSLMPVDGLPVLAPPPHGVIRGPLGRLPGPRVPPRPALTPLQMPPQGFYPPDVSPLPPLSACGVAAKWARSGAKALLHCFPISPSALHYEPPAHLFPSPAFAEDHPPTRLDVLMEELAQRSAQGLIQLFTTARTPKGRSAWLNGRLCRIGFALHLARSLPPSKRTRFASNLRREMLAQDEDSEPLASEIQYYLAKSLVLLPMVVRENLLDLHKMAGQLRQPQASSVASFLQDLEGILEQMCLAPIKAADMFDTFKRQAGLGDRLAVMPILGVYTRWMDKALFETGLLGDPLGSPQPLPAPEPSAPVSAEALVDRWVSSATAALSSPSAYSLDVFQAPPPAHLFPPLPQPAHEPSALEKRLEEAVQNCLAEQDSRALKELGQKESTSWNADDLWSYRSSFLARLMRRIPASLRLRFSRAIYEHFKDEEPVTSPTNGGIWKRSGAYQYMYERRHWLPVIAEPFNKLKSQVIAENPGAMSMFARLEDFFEQISIWPLHVKEDLQRRALAWISSEDLATWMGISAQVHNIFLEAHLFPRTDRPAIASSSVPDAAPYAGFHRIIRAARLPPHPPQSASAQAPQPQPQASAPSLGPNAAAPPVRDEIPPCPDWPKVPEAEETADSLSSREAEKAIAAGPPQQPASLPPVAPAVPPAAVTPVTVEPSAVVSEVLEEPRVAPKLSRQELRRAQREAAKEAAKTHKAQQRTNPPPDTPEPLPTAPETPAAPQAPSTAPPVQHPGPQEMAALWGLPAGGVQEVVPEEIAHLHCPISKVLLTDPVIAADGRSYQRAHFKHYLMQCQAGGLPYMCPCDPSTVLSSLVVCPNLPLREQVRQYQAHLRSIPPPPSTSTGEGTSRGRRKKGGRR